MINTSIVNPDETTQYAENLTTCNEILAQSTGTYHVFGCHFRVEPHHASKFSTLKLQGVSPGTPLSDSKIGFWVPVSKLLEKQELISFSTPEEKRLVLFLLAQPEMLEAIVTRRKNTSHSGPLYTPDKHNEETSYTLEDPVLLQELIRNPIPWSMFFPKAFGVYNFKENGADLIIEYKEVSTTSSRTRSILRVLLIESDHPLARREVKPGNWMYGEYLKRYNLLPHDSPGGSKNLRDYIIIKIEDRDRQTPKRNK